MRVYKGYTYYYYIYMTFARNYQSYNYENLPRISYHNFKQIKNFCHLLPTIKPNYTAGLPFILLLAHMVKKAVATNEKIIKKRTMQKKNFSAMSTDSQSL